MSKIKKKNIKYYNYKNLKNRNFIKQNFQNYSFRKSNLEDVNFSFSNLEGVDFWGANLKNTNFSNCNLKTSILTDTQLNQSIINKTNFINANLSHANLKNLDLRNSKINLTNLREATYNKKTKWPKNFNPVRHGAILQVKKINIKKTQNKVKTKIIKIAKEIKYGKGYYVIENFFNKHQIARAKKNLLKDNYFHCLKNKVKHSDKRNYQKWIWNLIGRDKIFRDMIQPKLVMQVFEYLLGKNFICGLFSANILSPGARGQSPHIDYPYLNMVLPGEKTPVDNKKFLLNCQTLIMVDDFNDLNGATQIVPGSQNFYKYPLLKDFKSKKNIHLNYSKGTLVIFNGLTWHKSGSNYSYKSRIGILGQYLPYFIKPMLNLRANLNYKVLNKSSERLKQLLGVGLSNPEIRF